MAEKSGSYADSKTDRSFREVLKQLAEDSSLHGVPKIVSSRQLPIKILWCLLFLSTFVVLMIQIHSLFVTYYAFPIQTTVSLEFSPLTFPAVTLCNMNPVRRSEVSQSTPVREIIYPKVRKTSNTGNTGNSASRKKRSPVKSQDHGTLGFQPQRHYRQATQTRKRIVETKLQSDENVFDEYENLEFVDRELLARIKRDADSQSKASNSNVQDTASFTPESISQTMTMSASEGTGSINTISTSDTVSSMNSLRESVSALQASSTIASTSASETYSEIDSVSESLTSSQPMTSVNSVTASVDSSYSIVPSASTPGITSHYSANSQVVSSTQTYLQSSTSFNNNYSTSYYYEYDYWGNYWGNTEYSTQSDYSDSFYQEWAEWYSQYYSSLYGLDDDHYSDNNYGGFENYLYDQYFSPKDMWDERIVNFQTVFRNESTTLRQNMGHKKEDVIVGATFVRTVQNISSFLEFTTPEYGNCFTMTSPKYKAWRSGPAHGMKLTLNLEVNEYIENFATGYGIRVVFHAPGTYPLASEEGLTLSPGYETSVGLRLVQISRLGDPYGECSDGKSFYQKYGIHYTTAACMQFCRVRKAIEMCNCIPHDAPDVNFDTNVNVCKNSGADKLCTIKVDVKFDDGSYSRECNCKSPCHELIYEKTLSGRRWPNDDYLMNVLLSNACEKNITSLKDACGHLENNTFDFEMSEKYRNNFLQLVIYYEDLNYESISQEPLYKSVRFLSDIGGAMGLFLGASMLSFVEFLQLGLEICLFLWKKLVKSQQIKSVSPAGRISFVTPAKKSYQTQVSVH